MLKLRRLSLAYSAILLATLGANGIFAFKVMQAQERTAAADSHRLQAIAVVLDVQREIGTLARFVRAFTTTGEIRYLSYYYDILAIRNGEKAIPEAYWSSSYWDEVVAGNLHHKIPPNGVKKSLQDRMGELGFDLSEFAALQTVIEATEVVKAVEQVAFAATQGLYDPATRAFVSEGSPHLEFAGQLVHGSEYNKAQADLARAVERLVQVTDQRTGSAIGEANERLESWITVSVIAAMLSVLVVIVGFVEMNQRLLRPVQQLRGAAARMAGGRYDTRTAIGNSVEELHLLGQTMDEMAKSIQDDIFHRETSQRALEEARNRAETATEAKSLFLANMSHEIRTPMNAILGMSYLALGTELSPRQRDYIEKVHSSAKVLLGIINDILDFSKIEAGKLALENTVFQLDEVIANAMILVRQRAEEKTIELIYEIDSPELAGRQGLIGDPLRLGQILVNLLANAVKFTEHGQVKLVIQCQPQDDGRLTLKIAVADTGIGMSRQQVAGLFREFAQADGSITRKFGGTGLGLAITKRLCELMGGSIEARSQPGQGSTFTATLSFAKASPEASTVAPVDFSTVSALVVDDNAFSRQAICRLLTMLGVNARALHSAGSGSEAIQILEAAHKAGEPVDLLLLDWVMPDLPGDAVLQELGRRGIPLPAKTAIVSAFDSDLLRHSAKLPADCHVLPKPLLPTDLLKLFGTIPSEAQPPATPPPSALEGMRVLLVEDNQLNQQLAREILTGWGIRVDICNHGQEAIECLDAQKPNYYDLVLLDLQMPVMDGYQTARHLRTNPAYAKLPIVAMSAHTLSGEGERCLALGMNGHIGKPFEPEQLFEQLLHFFGRQNQLPWSAASSPAPPEGQSVGLRDISGIDMEVGLRRSAGRPDLYQRILARFRADYANFGTELETLFEAENWVALSRQAHTLKGIAGTIGALELEAGAHQLETDIAAASPASIRQQLDIIKSAVAGLLDSLAASPDRTAQIATPSPSNRDILAKLRHLLATGDTEAVDYWRTMPSDARNSLHISTQNRLGRALVNFDFHHALELLDHDSMAGTSVRETS